MVSEKQEQQPFLSGAPRSSNYSKSGSRIPSVLVVCALGISVVLNLAALYQILTWSAEVDLDRICGSFTEQHNSPFLDAIPTRYDTVRYNGSLLKEDIYRGPASPDVDAAWEELGVNVGGMVIPEQDAERYGLDVGMVKRAPRQGGGFIVQSEGFHHLHCLNLLRQAAWFNHDYYQAKGEGPFANSERILEKHVSHCVDILRQQLMCTFDTSVFGQWWVKDKPFVDFNTEHRCKNFGEYRDWYKKQALPDTGVLAHFRAGDTVLSEIP